MDADKIKEFFLFHFEKMILVVVIAASAFLIYQGLQLPNFLEKNQPDKLSSEATRVKGAIDENHNERIIPPRTPTFDIVKETAKVFAGVDPTIYKLPNLWDRSKGGKSMIFRQDPLLLSPRSIAVTGVATSIAVRGSTTDDAAYLLASLEDAEPLEKVEEKPKRQPRRSRRTRGGGGEDMMGMEDMMEDMMEMEMEMEMEMGMGMDMGSSMGGTRKFDSKNDFGMRPRATEDKRNPEPSVGWFIAGTAVVPHKELYEAFELALQAADGYDPRRDTPFYFNLEVQRADVTDKTVDELVDEDWVKSVQTKNSALWDRELYTKLAAYRWSGFAPEIVPEDYRDEALTMWIPPVLLDDYYQFATHPLVPMVSQADLKRMANLDEPEEEIIDFAIDMDDGTGLVGPGQTGGIAGGGMAMDMEMEMDMMDDMDGMMMGMGMAMMGRGVEKDPVDYKLIRFYDFAGFKNSPIPGRKYVYRLRYSVNDPNFPFSQLLQPKTNTLAPEVVQRVQQRMADAVKNKRRAFQRWSDWSEPSEPVSLPSLEQYYAGSVTIGTVNVWQVRGKDVEYARDVPKAKMVASQYDPNTGTRIPMRLDVTEGSVLSAKAETADVVDPITLRVKKLPDAELVSGTTIVDIDGGRQLKITGEEELNEPAMMLLYDQEGRLKVTDEVSDLEYYRIYSYADERGEK